MLQLRCTALKNFRRTKNLSTKGICSRGKRGKAGAGVYELNDRNDNGRKVGNRAKVVNKFYFNKTRVEWLFRKSYILIDLGLILA